ncbi:hypothetical protein PoB_003696200 [Plakobranchus ocellatus]|uniref:Uncharacterized protein n=1 Tax=Plakobranchus ocellatus TaxID=259542 RepID=A0AAV4AU43_9GAST|nr:hypothetical protein PoB_003696200 [Plakobranchus ocellatus]
MCRKDRREHTIETVNESVEDLQSRQQRTYTRNGGGCAEQVRKTRKGDGRGCVGEATEYSEDKQFDDMSEDGGLHDTVSFARGSIF